MSRAAWVDSGAWRAGKVTPMRELRAPGTIMPLGSIPLPWFLRGRSGVYRILAVMTQVVAPNEESDQLPVFFQIDFLRGQRAEV